MNRRRIGILGFEGVSDIGFTGPLQAFATAAQLSGESARAAGYEVIVLGVTSNRFSTESGIVLEAQQTIERAGELDTIIVPGGSGLRDAELNGRVAAWVAQRASGTRRIVSICTGIYGIAPTGLLDHRRVTTHWRFVADVRRRFPTLDVQENALFVQDGNFFTSAGGTAGIDLAMALIAQDHGGEVALAVARDLLVYLRRDGGQEQYSEPSAHDLEIPTEFGALIRWIDAHLGGDLRLEKLASRAGIGKVQFIRQFKSTFGVTPALFIKNRRLNVARRRLLAGESTATVAREVGFRSALYFAQEFKWRFGTGPDEYQSRFRFTAKLPSSTQQKMPTADRPRGRRWDLRRNPQPAASTAPARKRADVLLNAA